MTERQQRDSNATVSEFDASPATGDTEAYRQPDTVVGEGGIPHTDSHERVPSSGAGPTQGRAFDIGGGSHPSTVGDISSPEWTEADAARDELRLPVVVRGIVAAGDHRRLVPGGKDGPMSLVEKRTASAIRERLRGSFDDRLVLLEDMADGEVMSKVEAPLSELAGLLTCPQCGELGLVPRAGDVQEVWLKGSATPKERLTALDILAKYGLGQLKEVSVENVREKVAQTIAVVRRLCEPELAEQVVAAYAKIWKSA